MNLGSVDFCCNRQLLCCFFTCRLISHLHTTDNIEDGAAKAAGEEGAKAVGEEKKKDARGRGKGSAKKRGGGRLNDSVDFCCNRHLLCCFFTCRLISHLHTTDDIEDGAANTPEPKKAKAGNGRLVSVDLFYFH